VRKRVSLRTTGADGDRRVPPPASSQRALACGLDEVARAGVVSVLRERDLTARDAAADAGAGRR